MLGDRHCVRADLGPMLEVVAQDSEPVKTAQTVVRIAFRVVVPCWWLPVAVGAGRHPCDSRSRM
jgi:hypothetical protein